jgi:DNA-directed RNA polymerase subunit N
MIIPVRCFSCGKPIAGHYEEMKSRMKKGEKLDEIFQHLGVTRYCCRRMLLAHVDVMDDVLKYNA